MGLFFTDLLGERPAGGAGQEVIQSAQQWFLAENETDVNASRGDVNNVPGSVVTVRTGRLNGGGVLLLPAWIVAEKHLFSPL